MSTYGYQVEGTSVRVVEHRHARRSFAVVEGGRGRRSAEEISKVPAASTRSIVYKRAHASAILGSVALLCGLVVCGLLALCLSAHVRDAAYERSLASVDHYEQIVVKPGQTLSGIAEQYPVEGLSTSQVVDLLMSRNGLDSSLLQVGSALDVPLTQ